MSTPAPNAKRIRRLGVIARWSGLAFVAIFAALFVLSFIRYDVVEHNRGTLIRPTPSDPYVHHILDSISVFNGRGAIVVSWWDYESVGPTEESMRVWKDMYGFRFEHSRPGPMGFRRWFDYEDRTHWRIAGIGLEAFTRGGTSGYAILLPHWLPLVAFASPWLAHALGVRARRRRAGLCAKCGYDRAGLGPEVPCPECGRPA